MSLAVRLVVPLIPIAIAPIAAARLNPVFAPGGEWLVMVTQYAAGVPERELGRPAFHLAAHGDEIMAAFDMLRTGY